MLWNPASHGPEPTWWEWKAWWEKGDHFIEIGMTLFDDPPLRWGKSGIEAYCDMEDLIALLGLHEGKASGSMVD